MVVVMDLLVSALTATVVTGTVLRTRPRLSLTFVIILLSAWAGGIWIRPVSPLMLGVSPLAFGAAGLITALILRTARASFRAGLVPRDHPANHLLRREAVLYFTVVVAVLTVAAVIPLL